MQDGNIPWSVANRAFSVPASVVQRETTHALDMVVEPKLDVSSVLIPVLGRNTSIFFQNCLMILCFWFLREYIPHQDLVAGDRLDADTRRRQLVPGKDFKTRGRRMECVQRLDETGYPRSKRSVVSTRNRSVASRQRVSNNGQGAPESLLLIRMTAGMELLRTKTFHPSHKFLARPTEPLISRVTEPENGKARFVKEVTREVGAEEQLP